MPPQADPANEAQDTTSSLGTPILVTAAFAAGAAAALVARRLLDRRRDAGGSIAEPDGGDDDSKDDLATVLRRAALDVAVLASGQAADRLRSQDEGAESEAEAEPRSTR